PGPIVGFYGVLDERIDFEWGNSAPTAIDGSEPPQVNGNPFPADGFAARWTGVLTIPGTGTVDRVFVGRSDDGIRVYLKEGTGPILSTDAPIVNAWVDRGPANTSSGTITLKKGTPYTIVVEYYENGGGAVAHLRWREPAQTSADAVNVGSGALSETITPGPAPQITADNVAPGAPTNLTASEITSNTAKLTFVAPGDDGQQPGRAGCYEIRRSAGPITEANFEQATAVGTGTLIPDPQGTTQTLTITNLPSLENINVAVRALDEAGNKGPISNVVTIQTPSQLATYPANGVTSEIFLGRGGTCIEGNDLKGWSKFQAGAYDIVRFDPHFELYGLENINTLPPGDVRNDYGARMRAIFTAPQTGAYTFYIAADDDTELAISNPVTGTATPDPSTLKAIAGNPACSWDPIRAWGRHSQDGPIADDPATPENEATNASVSAPVQLTAGQKILIQALVKEGGGGDNLAVGAVFPDGTDGTNNVPTDPLIGVENTDQNPTAAQKQLPEFMRPINTKYLTPWRLPEAGRLRGIVTDANNNPVRNARVQIQMGDVTTTVNTDASGAYSTLVSPGAVNITADMFPYTQASATATATVTANQISTADIKINFTPVPFKPANPDPQRSDDFSGALKSVWKSEDIAALDGVTEVQNGVLNITGIGADIWDGGDQFRYVYQNITDDTFEAVVQVLNMPTTDGWAKVGVMARETTDTVEHHAFAAATTSNGPSGQGRIAVVDTDGTDTNVNTNLGGAFPQGTGYWMKLVREGRKFNVFWSPDGIQNNFIRTIDFTTSPETDAFAAASILLGIAATTHDTNPGATEDPVAKVDNFIFSGTVAVPTPGPGGGVGCKGDVNGDKTVNVGDAVAILRHAVAAEGSPDRLTGQNLANADANGDNAVNVGDAVSVLQAVVNLAPGNTQIPSLTCP
ncbi:MAG: carboxypeptidase regulatory-like domain-containing protein, partial [Armatimonadetes bacterium]|nr:carboxypeptidase regulatory-like domain-containing protein [Armatimonadota bacterium]